MYDKTMTFSVYEDKGNEMKQILTTVYDALKEFIYRNGKTVAVKFFIGNEIKILTFVPIYFTISVAFNILLIFL